MALVKCSECGKQVSDKANTCPACGNPIGGGVSVAISAFEKRIEQYKANGYNLLKRDGDTVKLFLRGNTIKNYKKGSIKIMLFWGLLMIIGAISGLICALNLSLLFGVFTAFVTVILGLANIIKLDSNARIVIISLTKTGKIEETGNVLKNK